MEPRLGAGLATRDTVADPAAVVARATAIRRRRYALSGGAAVSLATVLGVMAAYGTSSSSGAGVLTPIAESPATTPEATFDPAPEPTPTATPAATAAPTLAPRAEPTAEPSEKRPEPTREPAPKGTFAPPGAKATIAPIGSVTTGEQVAIVVRVTDTDGEWGGTTVEYGDGTKDMSLDPVAGCAGGGSPRPTGYTPRPSDETRTFRHVYRQPGTYVVSVEASTYTAMCQESGPGERVKATVTFTVTGERLPSNGPEQPTASVDVIETGGLDVMLEFQPRDVDGVLVAYSLDWGDGSAPYTFSRDARCYHTNDQGYASGGTEARELTHTYPAGGTYEITMTVTSAGCDGRDEQHGTGSREITVTPYE